VFYLCNLAVLEFFLNSAYREEFEARRVLEVGSKYVNGSVRPIIERFCSPAEYIGVDIESGKYVDIVLPAERLIQYFGEESFDVIISTELLEHVRDWRTVINNMKAVLRKSGYIYLTTRSKGFPFHAYPYDYWRYELDDIERIFADFEILKLIKDPEAPGVFLKARKPSNWNPCDLGDIELYSMVLGKRTKEILDWSRAPLLRKMKSKATSVLSNTALLVRRSIGRKLLT